MNNLFDMIIYLATILGAVATIFGIAIKWLDKKLKTILKPVQNQIHKMDVKECRRLLVDFLADIEHGMFKNEIQWNFAHEVYDHYTLELGENSYVKDKWESIVNGK